MNEVSEPKTVQERVQETAETETTALARAKLETDLESIATSVWTVVQPQQGQSMALLAVLRLLERLHQEIRDGLFQESLPENRQALYALLRDIEQQGGWPYIHRMKLQAFLTSFLSEVVELAEASTETLTEAADRTPQSEPESEAADSQAVTSEQSP
ncbi:MAG: hypothetical protein KME07_03625 [Pegethrix bostrychoides GSE-TBD4-15B]|uniref:Uncharacterized protein n=1 Tax=Pegethrix bostrychoides GSE-TBD4-15B TaxID=2839662 RepID=A0A951P7N5_9CYAN|nr:hypothetical protein [Pegethrix bostrychoides GSE-TBD4-15B]